MQEYGESESDIDTTPITIQVKCDKCGEIETKNIIREELCWYDLLESGLYVDNLTGECFGCMTNSVAAQEERRSAWRQVWPNHCKKCCGNGGVAYSYDPSPVGVSLSSGSMADFEPCEACAGQGTCPRCGKPGLTSEARGDIETGAGPCTFCGWDYAIGGIPE